MADSKEEPKPFDMMEYRLLGGTGLAVSTLGLGMMTITTLEQTKALMYAVRKYGVNFFDNAELYGNPCGTAEKLFGSALKELQKEDAKLWRRSALVITTKLLMGPGDGEQPNSRNRQYGANDRALSRKHLMEGIDGSLARMQLDYVDVVYAHRVDRLTPMEEIVRAFTDIIQSGKAFYWGTSMWPAQKITEAYWIAKMHKLIPPVVEQPAYNMFVRKYMEDEYLDMFKAPYRLGATVFTPLDSGVLTGKYSAKSAPKEGRLKAGKENWLGVWYGNENYFKGKLEKVDKLKVIAEELGISMVSLAISWVIKNKNVSCCMLGGTKPGQLEQNIEAIAAAKKLTPEILAKIEEILGNKPTGDFLMGQTRFMVDKTSPL